MTEFTPRDAGIRTADGSYFFYDGDETDTRGITTANIGHALALTCRFGGHVPHFYSVAQHSVLVARLCADEFWPWALLHDGAEFALPDVPRPGKEMLPDYKALENRILCRIAHAYDLDRRGIPAEVKHADLIALCAEAWLLHGVSGITEWGVPVDSVDVANAVEELNGMGWWSWRRAKQAYVYCLDETVRTHGLTDPDMVEND